MTARTRSTCCTEKEARGREPIGRGSTCRREVELDLPPSVEIGSRHGKPTNWNEPHMYRGRWDFATSVGVTESMVGRGGFEPPTAAVIRQLGLRTV